MFLECENFFRDLRFYGLLSKEQESWNFPDIEHYVHDLREKGKLKEAFPDNILEVYINNMDDYDYLEGEWTEFNDYKDICCDVNTGIPFVTALRKAFIYIHDWFFYWYENYYTGIEQEKYTKKNIYKGMEKFFKEQGFTWEEIVKKHYKIFWCGEDTRTTAHLEDGELTGVFWVCADELYENGEYDEG